MSNEWRKQVAQKRGASQTVSFDAQDAEQRYAVEPADETNPQKLYEQVWAVAVLEQAATLLEAEYRSGRKQGLFDQLAPFLQGERPGLNYSGIGAQLGMTEGAVKVAVHRLRQRFRELLRASVANTVADPLEVDGELRHLLHILSN